MLNIGDTFNNLTCFEFLGGSKNEWICKCKCGNNRTTTENSLLKGYAKSCGCLQRNKNYGNLTGQQFNKLTIIEPAFSNRGNKAYKCRCACGNEVILETSDIITGNNKSCGQCLKRKYQDLTGNTFKHWTVLHRIEKDTHGPAQWHCKCVCGKVKDIWSETLLSEKAIGHCGCIDKARRTYEQEQRNLLRRNRKYIIERDNCSCQLCGNVRQSFRLKVHHIYPFKEYEDLRLNSENLLTLCRSCHTLVHGNHFKQVDSRYQKILLEIMNWIITDKQYNKVVFND